MLARQRASTCAPRGQLPFVRFCRRRAHFPPDGKIELLTLVGRPSSIPTIRIGFGPAIPSHEGPTF
jgi:hypothetical protein